MVFESIVVDILNRTLGSYFENLDTSQLKLGIWGGDAVLRDLLLKTSAMDDMGLPFKVVIGKLGNLTMKIPWQSLYTAPVELNLKNLYLLIVPSYAVVYNEEVEENAAQAKKQAEIARIDELRKLEQARKAGTAEAPPPDSFSEKLITQVIKNVQIRIESIHIRYEDSVTIPKTPFAFGVTLKNLNVQTTDENWKLAIITETVSIIHKMANLEGLSVYWNSNTDMIHTLTDKPLMLTKLQEYVDKDSLLTNVVGPISSEGRIKLTPSPEKHKFAYSKFMVNVDMRELAIGMTNTQFQDAMSLAESLDYMSRAQYYRKYRPKFIEHKGHYKDWWKFAYRCIVEEDVRRRQLNWDWQHIKHHRQLVKVYTDFYYQKLTNTNKKLKPEIDAKIAQCEKALDVFNITLVRKQVEVRVERQAKLAPPVQSGGWFSGWFGGSAATAQSTSAAQAGLDIAKKFEEALTPEEKKKLYDAIDYTEGAAPVDYPQTYLAYVLNFQLHRLRCIIRDVSKFKQKPETILDLQVSNVENSISLRPYKDGFKVDLKMGSIEAIGVQRHEKIPPNLMSSRSTGVESRLVEASFETNPLNSSAAQKITLSLAPVEVIYHSKTIIELVKCFTLPQEMQLSKLQAATLATINEWKEQSAAGLQHLIDTRGEIDININFLAPYFLIPQGGALSKNGSVLIFDLGEINVKSKPRDRDKASKSDQKAKTKEEIRHEVIDKSYDCFVITLKDFQVLFALPGDNFRAAIKKTTTGVKTSSGMELIKSQEFVVQFEQCLVQDDPRLPKLKLFGTLPLLDLVITENRFLELMKLLVTLPLPKSAPPNQSNLSRDTVLAESVALAHITYNDITTANRKRVEDIVQFTELVINFKIQSIRFRINRVKTSQQITTISPLAELELRNFTTVMTQMSYSLGVNVSIGGLTVIASSHTAPGYNLGELYLIKTPMDEEQHLLKVTFFSISADCPKKFVTEVKQSIKVDVTSMDVILHQEALHTLVDFVSQITESFNNTLEMQDSLEFVQLQQTSGIFLTKKEDKKQQVSKFEATRKAVAKKHQDSKDILLELTAHLHRLTVQLSSEQKNILKVVLGHLDLKLEQRPKTMLMSMQLMEFDVLNLNPNGFYTKIISQETDKVIYIKYKTYDEATKGPFSHDVTKHDGRLLVETGSPRIVFLNPFLEEVMDFIDKFQTAKEAVVDASTAAAELASERVEQAYSGGTRILIDIEFKSPYIIIPKNAESSDGFGAYLGHLSVKNKFLKLETKGADKKTVMIDEIHVDLQNMQLSRIIMDKESQKVLTTLSILDPVTIRFDIFRNLGASYYQDIPAMRISGEVTHAAIRVSSEDYGILMSTLTENISSKYVPPPEEIKQPEKVTSKLKLDIKTKAQVARQLSTLSVKSTTALVDSGDTAAVTVRKPSDPDHKVNVNFKLELIMEKASVKLFSGSSNLQGKEGEIERPENGGFAWFSIGMIEVGVMLFTNNDMICSVSIGTINLEDIREGDRQIKNLIHIRKDKSPQGQSQAVEPVILYNDDGTVKKPSVIRVNYRTDQSTKQGTTLTVDVTGMTFVLCLEYLLQLGTFFTAYASGGARKAGIEDKLNFEEFNFPGPGETGPILEITPPPPVSSDDAEPEEAQPNRMFVTLGETDVILVETVERIDTNGLLLNCELSMRQITEHGKTNIMCSINKVRLCTCKYDPENRNNSLAEVMSPMSITFVMNDSKVAGTLIDINISDIYIRLTAGTLELLLKILSSSFQASTSDNTENKKLDYSHIWDVKYNKNSNFWFLNPDTNVELGVDALVSPDDTARLFDAAEDLDKRERLVLESGCIVITFETGSGNNTMPVLLIESDIDMQAFDWSQKLQMTGRMKLEAAYYNAIFGMWEFLIEPVETRHHGKVSHRPWELFFEYNTIECTNVLHQSRALRQRQLGENTNDIDLEGQSVGGNQYPSYMSVSLQSNDILELTVTKTALDVVNLLQADFQEAVKALVSQKEVITSAYSVTNDLGTDVKLDFRDSPFTLVRKGQIYEEALLKPGTSLNLTLAENFDTTRRTSFLKEQEGREERLLRVIIQEYNFTVEIPVNRAEKRYYPLKKKTSWGGNYAILCDTSVSGTSKIITIRSVIQVINHLKIPVDVYYMSENGNTIVLAGTAEKEKHFNIPINCCYSKSSELYFAPAGYNVSSLACVWTTLLTEDSFENQLLCRMKSHDIVQYHLKVIGEGRQVLFEGTNRQSEDSRCCYIHLKPPLIINNMLPVELNFALSEKSSSVRKAEKGHSIQVTDLKVDVQQDFTICLKIPNYEDESWTSTIQISKSTPELSPWIFTSDINKEHILYLGIHKDTSDESLTLHLYSPFWMVNRTGLTLAYHAEDHKDMNAIIHEPSQNPVLFSFHSGKSFFKKKKAVVRIEDKSDWSSKFPVDVAGSAGSVTCKSPTKDYEIGIEIILSGWGLTKTIIFTPRYYLINQCSYTIEVTESENLKSKLKILPNKCEPFWPSSRTPHLFVRIDHTNEFSKMFSYEKSDEILLVLRNKYGGVQVDIHITEASHLITFTEFVEGQAAVLVVNNTPDQCIEFADKGNDIMKREIKPGENQLLAWFDPMGEKVMTWSPVGVTSVHTDKLNMDGFGTYKAPNDKGEEREYHWVSFLDGLKRVLLFTTDKNHVSALQASRDIEVPTAEYTLNFHGLGISLVDSSKCIEILYMRIASSEIQWESQKIGRHQRFKPIPHKKSSIIEYAYQNYLTEKVVNPNVKSHVTLDAGLEVDFLDMKMFKPYDRNIRRVFQTGLWVHYKTYPHTLLIHAKLNRLQIDNQLPGCIFQTVLAPVPPPRSVSSADAGPKPFAEVSILERIIEHSSVVQFKYFKVLVQEFAIKMDINFVNAIVAVFSEDAEKQLERMVDYFNKDYEEVITPLDVFLDRHVTAVGQKNFYDFLHFSPLKIHLSFSMGGATQLSNTFLNLLITSLGVSVTEVQDVVFKLACMELQHLFLTQNQLYNEAYQHYSSQALRQLYVLVLGLDVIGNPYGLLVGFGQGVGAFFYEPFHGAIQGPGEFMEGLALGVKSLFGHTIGGVSGAMSKITGTFGKGVAALTLDDEYQQKRRENISKRQTAADGFVESGKDLVMGFVNGFTGVFTQPVRGAKKDGVEGFFKGLGKGAIGLVTRPAGGIIDFTSGSFDAVKKATSVSDETRRMRPPRFIPPNNALQPYVLHEAEGMTLFYELEKGKYAATDTYIAHALVNPHAIYVILLTNKRVLYLKKIDIFGGWTTQWTSMWEELEGPPELVEPGLRFRIKPSANKAAFMKCQSRPSQITIPLYSPDVCTWLLDKIEIAMKQETGIVVGTSVESMEHFDQDNDENLSLLQRNTPLQLTTSNDPSLPVAGRSSSSSANQSISKKSSKK